MRNDNTVHDLDNLGKTGHPQVRVLFPFTRETIEVDKGMSELLKSFWALGIETSYSCQGYPSETGEQTYIENEFNLAYILFSRTSISMKLTCFLLEKYPLLQPYIPCQWYIEIDNEFVQGGRICYRFPPEEIPSVQEYIELFSEEMSRGKEMF